MKKGYIHIYTGDGKGKTTAALGLALRASGRGLSTYIGQFMKGQYYGELSSVDLIDNITIRQFGDCVCIRKEDVTNRHIHQAEKGLEKCAEAIEKGIYDIVIMDEICVAIWFGLVPETEIIRLMQSKPEKLELILTGRKASLQLINYADLVTEMKEIKHYYRSLGILARQGIEN